MKIALLGVGALGSLFGGCLSIANADVSLLLRSKRKFSLLNNKGLKIDFRNRKYHIFPNTFLIGNIKSRFDLIILLTKTIDSYKALNSIKSIIDSNTVLMSIQNGLDNDIILEKFVPQKNIIYGTTMAAADLESQNKVCSFGSNITRFKAKRNNSLTYAKTICALLNKVGIESQINSNVNKYIWEKVAFNSSINSICALLNCTPKIFQLDNNLKKFAINVVIESYNIASANNIKLDKNKIIETINISSKEHGDHKPSMLQDVLSKKPTEIDSINGALVKYGLHSKVSTDLNYSLLKLIKAKEKNY